MRLAPFLVASLAAASLSAQEPTVRLQEIVQIEGVRPNTLTGIGVLTGLKGTGDGTAATRQALVSYLTRMNLHVGTDTVASGNIALVNLHATLPPFARHGTPLDVTVSSIGEATSLRGGILLPTELLGVDRKVYALASGAVIIGGFEAKGSNAKLTQNHPTVGAIPGGAICETTVDALETRILNERGELNLVLRNPSFETTNRVTKAINGLIGERGIGFARSDGDNLVSILLDRSYQSRGALTGLIAQIHALEVEPDPTSRVLLDEKTGTIIIGKDVRISPCMIQVQDLTIQIIEEDLVSQPLPGINQGTTEKVGRTRIDVTKDSGKPQKLEGAASLSDLAKGLQALGIDFQKMLTVLQFLESAGLLHAEVVVK